MALNSRPHGDERYIEAGVRNARYSLGTSSDVDYRITSLHHLGIALERRYKWKGDVLDLDEAISLVEEAIAVGQDGHRHRGWMLRTLGGMLALRYRENKELQILEQAIRVAREAVKITDVSHRTDATDVLEECLESRFELKKDVKDIDEAILLVQEAIKCEPEDRDTREVKLFTLEVKRCLYELQSQDTGEHEENGGSTSMAIKSFSKEEFEIKVRSLLNQMEDKNRHQIIAQLLQQIIVEFTPGRYDLAEAARFSGLASEFEVRFLVDADIGDLEKAIEFARLALQLTPECHSTRAQELCNLGRKLQLRYNRIGELYDIEDAIRLARKAASLFPEGAVGRASPLSSLGEALYSRYCQMGEKTDLEDAILAERQAVELAPDATTLSNLGDKLHDRYIRTGEINDLTEAIQVTQRAIKLSADNELSSASLLGRMGDMLHSRHRQTKKIQDLEEAILVARQALVLNPGPAQMTSLGNKLQIRCDRTKDIHDVTEVIRIFRRAVEVTPEDDPNLAGRLRSLAIALESRYLLKARAKDLDSAVRCFCKSSNSLHGTPIVRLQSAREAIRIFHERGDWEKAFLWAKSRINLLQRVSNRYSSLEDQQHAITQISGFSADTCSLAVKVGNAELAIQMLEQGRGMIVGYLIDSRNEYPQLKKDYPALAEQYSLLREQISMPARTLGPVTPSQYLKGQREIIPEINDILYRIRQKPGYESFLLEPNIEELKSCAAEGPIVVVNITDIGADAITVSTGEIRTIPLVKISPKTVPLSTQQQFQRYTLSRRGDGHTRKIGSEPETWDSSVLNWLWYCCVKPILDDLETRGLLAVNDISRIWWIGSGIASSFPFHAAGADFLKFGENTLSRVIPSYTPTIKALAYSRIRAVRHDPAQWGDTSILAITMPTTPGQNPLTGVERERKAIWEACKGAFSCEHLNLPTAADALDKMAEADIVHFACHGSSDPGNPLASHLLLQKNVLGKAVLDKLTVSSISNASVERRARIAFLSACSTAETKTSQLSDEGLHLASAFQVAGFAHVIGSLWAADDDVCVRLAELFYLDLINSGNTGFVNRSVALALRNAILQVRSEFPDESYIWAPFIHFGA